jgi:hypothetical protein
MAPGGAGVNLNRRRGADSSSSPQKRRRVKIGVQAATIVFLLVILFFLYNALRLSKSIATTTTNQHTSKANPKATYTMSKKNRLFPTVDILNVGSLLQPLLSRAQKETMGSHRAVRNFFHVTEVNDTETACSKNLTLDHMRRIVHFCLQPAEGIGLAYTILKKMRSHYARMKWLQKKVNPPGWMCAQKRPFDGFAQIIATYESQSDRRDDNDLTIIQKRLPDYLIIMDDDTWVNLDNVLQYIPNEYPMDEPHAVAGCMIRSNIYKHNFTIVSSTS